MSTPTVESAVTASRQTLSELVAKVLDQLSVSAWLPSGVLVFVILIIGSLRSTSGRVQAALTALGNLSASALILLFIGVVLGTVLTQAFQFEAIRMLEGYWGPGRLRDALADRRCRHHLEKRDELWARLEQLREAAVEEALAKMADEVSPRVVDLVAKLESGELQISQLPKHELKAVQQNPWEDFATVDRLRRIDSVAAAARRYPEDDRAVRPTRLGNTLRSYEDPIEEGIGRPIESFVQDIFDTLPATIQADHDQLRSRLDLYCSLVMVFVLGALVSGGCLSDSNRTLAVACGLVCIALAWLSYRAANTSARAYGSLLQTIAGVSGRTGPEPGHRLTHAASRFFFMRRFG